MVPFKGIDDVFLTFLDMLSGKELWFFPCFIIGEIIHFFVRKNCRSILGIAITSTIFCLVGLFAHKHGVLNYAMINRAFTVQPFFLIGYFFRVYESDFIKLRWELIAGLLIVYIVLCCLSMVLFPGKTLDVHLNQYYNIPYCFLQVFLGCFILFTAASKAEIKSSFMSFIGQNTLVLYIWHAYAIAILIKVISFAGWTMPFNWWMALIMVLWSCLVCGICAIFLNRYLPFFVGKKGILGQIHD
jgi:peptidoglycan/LPS O-acetylase OafA/YrhL